MRVERAVAITLLFLVISLPIFAQQYKSMKPKHPIICYSKSTDEHTHVDAPEKYLEWKRSGSARIKTATFEVTYIGFSDEAKAAFQSAVDIWETLVTSSVPIRINATWQPLGTGVLGSAIWGTVHANFDGAQRINTWYPAALAEKMAGQELNDATEFDIYANFNSNFNWFYGTGAITTGQYDLITVVLHEIGHGLGFVDSFGVSGSLGFVGVQDTGVPMIYDQQMENNAGQNIYHDFASGTSELAAEITSNGVFYNSPSVVTNFGGRARIYSPNPYNGGSSMSHLDETTFLAGTAQSLMTPQIGAMEINHNPGSIVMGAFSDMGWEFTFIKHTNLKDTEDEDGPYVVKAIITTENGPLGQPKLHYIAGGPETIVNMAPTGNPNEFQATIPATGNPTTYGYYISVTDNLNREYTRPGKLIRPTLSDQQFYTTFTSGPDTQKPRITHSPKAFILNTDIELEIQAIVSDNLGLGEVKIQYLINDVAQPDISMNAGMPDSLYSATIDLGGGLSIGDMIKYKILAIDNSVAQNSATNPANGYHEINVTGLAPTQDSYINDFNTTSDDFFGEGFSVTIPSGFSDPALHTTHPYSEGNGFPNNQLFLIYQLRIPIRVKSQDATIKFDEIVLVEPGEAGSVFGSENFFDYVVVEGSKDGGVNWTPVADGYDSRDFTDWLTKYNSSISGNNSTAVGDPSLFRSRTLNLLNKFTAGDEVAIRFKLFSDPFAAGWGWAIDNLKIQIDDIPPAVLHDHFDYRLATDDNMVLQTKVTDASGIQDLAVEVQVNSQPIQVVNLSVTDGVEEYSLDLDISNLSVGDVISYRIIAHDTKNNEGTFPPTGTIKVVIFSPAAAQTEYTNNFNSATTDFIGNFFSIIKPSGFVDNAIHSSHVYLNGLGLDNTSSYSYLLTKPITLSAENPLMAFDEIAIVQGHSASAVFGTPAFNDYVIVEGSDDGGATWKAFLDGYDAVGQSSWVSAFSGGLNGTASLFKKRIINLLANGNFQAGDDVLFRFRFFADATVNGWGWAIDNLSIQGPITSVEETLLSSDFKVYPNPAHTEVTIELNTNGTRTVNLTILNVQGQTVTSQQENTTDGLLKTTLDVSQLHDGLYLIKAETGGRSITKKVLKTSR